MTLLLALLVAQAAAEPFPYPPEQEKIAEEGYNQLGTDPARAEATLRQLTDRLASQNPRGWRLLGYALQQEGKHKEAIAAFDKAEALHVDARRLPSVLGARAASEMSVKSYAIARKDVDRALALDPSDLQALVTSAYLHGVMNDTARARADAERAAKVAPEAPAPHFLLANIYSSQGDDAASRAEIEKAVALKIPPSAFAATEANNRRLAARRLVWQVPLALVAAMALAVLLLLAAGGALSRVEMASLADLRRADASLSGESTAGERVVHAAYLAVLWFGAVFFYLSVPAMVALSLTTGLGLIWVMLTQLDLIPIKLVLILLVVAVGGTWAVIRSLFVRIGEREDGVPVTEADDPRLFAALREVGEVAGTRMVDRAYVEVGAEVGVRESGGAVRVLLGRGQRVLHLGYWALAGLDTSELKAILAHEYGHFSHGETRLTPVIGRIQVTMLQMLMRMAALGRSTWLNPVYWYLRFYLQAFLATTAGHSRRKELLADRAAALAYGGDAFGSALRRVVAADVVFDKYAAPIAAMLRRSGRPCTALYQAVAAAESAEPIAQRESRVREVLDRKPGRYDSHPPSEDRIARVAGVSGRRPRETERALALLSSPDATALKLAELVRSRVDAQLEAARVLPDAEVEMLPEAQALLAEGIALHDAAIALRDSDAPQSDALFLRAEEKLRAAVGDKDPILVPALANLAQAHERGGRSSDARAVAQRGLEILALHPDAGAQDQLQAILSRLDKAA